MTAKTIKRISTSNKRGNGTRPAWRRDPEGRRQRVLDAAARLFGNHAYREVTTSLIASSAGVAEGTLFHHFGSKDALLAEASARYGQGFADAMFAGLTPDRDVPDVASVIRRAFAYVRFNQPSFGIFLLTDEAGSTRGAKRANREAIVTRLATLFALWSERKQMREADPEILAELCFGLVEAALRECYAGGHVDDAREARYIREVSQCIRSMLRPAA